jgi:hypothetical protein
MLALHEGQERFAKLQLIAIVTIVLLGILTLIGDVLVRGLTVKRVQADEIWAFVLGKDKNLYAGVGVNGFR